MTMNKNVERCDICMLYVASKIQLHPEPTGNEHSVCLLCFMMLCRSESRNGHSCPFCRQHLSLETIAKRYSLISEGQSLSDISCPKDFAGFLAWVPHSDEERLRSLIDEYSNPQSRSTMLYWYRKQLGSGSYKVEKTRNSFDLGERRRVTALNASEGLGAFRECLDLDDLDDILEMVKKWESDRDTSPFIEKPSDFKKYLT